MKLRTYSFTTLLLILTTILLAGCSSGPAQKTQPDSLTSPAVQLDKGIYNYNNNDYASAINHFNKALLQYRSIDNQKGIAQSCMNLAKSYMATNHNSVAGRYLSIADNLIKQTPLPVLEDHLQLLKSSLAIKNAEYDDALNTLDTVINSNNSTTRLAAIKNRTRIAFLTNTKDRTEWLNKYQTLQLKNTEDTMSHQARILRFKAELSDSNKDKIKLLSQSLNISRNLANRTAIAANLTQWANIDSQNKRYLQAEDKYLRALFIRHQLGDIKNSQLILQQLQNVYIATGSDKQKRTTNWLDKISSRDLSGWHQLFLDFETFPVAP